MQKRLIKRNAFSSTNKSGVDFNAEKIKSHRVLFLNLIYLVYSTKFLLQMNFILMLSLNCLLFGRIFLESKFYIELFEGVEDAGLHLRCKLEHTVCSIEGWS